MNPDASLAECVNIAIVKYDTLMALSPDARRERYRETISDMVRQALAELRPYGVPSSVQGRVEWRPEGLRLPVIGYFDYATGPQISFGIFYLVPICLVAWLQTRRVAVVTACACAAVWLAVDRMTNRHAPATAAYWNMCVRLGFFLLITLLLNHLRFLASEGNLQNRMRKSRGFECEVVH